MTIRILKERARRIKSTLEHLSKDSRFTHNSNRLIGSLYVVGGNIKKFGLDSYEEVILEAENYALKIGRK